MHLKKFLKTDSKQPYIAYTNFWTCLF